MKRMQQVQYRVNLTEGFVLEAREDWAAKRWRACVDDTPISASPKTGSQFGKNYTLGYARSFCQFSEPEGNWCDSQLAVENAAKAALALLGPVGRTHDPAALLITALQENRFSPSVQERVKQLAESAQELGPEVHIKSDYGDENQGQTPWQLFGETDAKRALELAEQALALARQLLKAGE